MSIPNTINEFQKQTCCLKIEQTLTKTSKLSAVSLRHLKFEVVFPEKDLNQRIHFAALTLISSFNLLGEIMNCQTCSECETLHETEVLFCVKEGMVGSKT